MDSYCEHLIPIRKDKKMIGLLIFIWVVLAAIIGVCFLLLSKMGVFSFVLSVAAVIGGVWLTKQLNVEYEYIFTNGEIDVDIITSRTDRKRLITFKCKDIERIEKYRQGLSMFEKEQYAKKSIYCNAKDEDVYCIAVAAVISAAANNYYIFPLHRNSFADFFHHRKTCIFHHLKVRLAHRGSIFFYPSDVFTS